MRLLVSSVLVILFSTSGALARDSRDSLPIENQTGDQLRGSIAAMARKGHHPMNYKTARTELMGNISLEKLSDGNFVVHDVYCEKDFSSADFGPRQGPGPGRIPDANVLNTEHTWPQSKFGRGNQEAQKTDLHHLFPADNEMNGIRGNNPFGEVSNASKALKCPQSKAGYDSRGTFVFEPPESHRGNVARAIFYFAVRYGLSVDPVQEAVLRKWHDQDPVDAAEIERNNEVEKVQGNRNPFVDDPGLVSKVGNF